jgi:hypothetical protein
MTYIIGAESEGGVQITNLFVIKFSPGSCYFLPVVARYISQNEGGGEWSRYCFMACIKLIIFPQTLPSRNLKLQKFSHLCPNCDLRN